METRSELVAAISGRYARSRRDEKARILDEFVAVAAGAGLGLELVHQIDDIEEAAAGTASRPPAC